MTWAAQAREVANETFNITKGDVFEWRSLWLAMAEILEVDLGSDEPISLAAYFRDNADVWEETVEK
ncbi:hypothetical protein [Brevibacillus centrosporus]|uniref:hypothetical protein n=1 Tax=Brevibacillus centrosporus TaxID=54910 RepID=UPI003B029AA1